MTQYPWERRTEPIRTRTAPMEALGVPEAPPWLCAACGGPVEPLSSGHYQSVCLLVMRDTGFHFCCPGQCEQDGSEKAGAGQGTRR